MSLRHACRRPISQENKVPELFVEGVPCPACYTERTDDDRTHFAEQMGTVQLGLPSRSAFSAPLRETIFARRGAEDAEVKQNDEIRSC